jgi:hypothetical protein
MNRIKVLAAAACVLSIGFAHEIRVDFDHDASFSRYKTYSWAQMPGPAPNALFPNQLMLERVAGFVEEALAAKMLKHVPSGGDLLVTYRITVEEQPQYITFSDAPGPGWGWNWGWGWGWNVGSWNGLSTTTVETYYEETLVVELTDANRDKLVFQGASTQELSSKAEKNTKKLCKAVNGIFDKYPPRP